MSEPRGGRKRLRRYDTENEDGTGYRLRDKTDALGREHEVGLNRSAGRNGAVYRIDRRRFTKVPGYHGYLPRVFPFKVTLSSEDAGRMVDILAGDDNEGFSEYPFAVTRHVNSFDGHVTLWLSVEAAVYLVDTMEALGAVEDSNYRSDRLR